MTETEIESNERQRLKDFCYTCYREDRAGTGPYIAELSLLYFQIRGPPARPEYY